MSTEASPIIVTVKNSDTKDRQLEQAISRLQAKATDCGILVTRIDYRRFAVTLSTDIAFGLTGEKDLMRQK